MNRVDRGGETGCGAASYRRDRKSRLPSLVRALASAWQEIALRHPDLPPVLIGIGPPSRATATRRCHAHFAPAAWSPVGPNASAALKASSRALEEAIARRDLDALSDLLRTSAGLLIGEALQLSHDAHRIRAEVLVTSTAWPDPHVPWRRGRIQTSWGQIRRPRPGARHRRSRPC